jgi:predicted metal-dependent hydrolase
VIESRDACAEPPPGLLLEGIGLFNRGEFYEQHELLETLWRAEPRPVRRLYQGILQIGVAFHHLRRCNHHGAVHMLTRGQMYLRPFAPSCQGVDVERLLSDAARALAEVERLGPARLDAFDWSLVPKVLLVGNARPSPPGVSGKQA